MGSVFYWLSLTNYVVCGTGLTFYSAAKKIVSKNIFWHQQLLNSCNNFLRDIFPSHVKLYVHNDAIAALASGTYGKLHGCVLIAGTGCIAYGFTEDGQEARAAGAGPVLGDWGR